MKSSMMSKVLVATLVGTLLVGCSAPNPAEDDGGAQGPGDATTRTDAPSPKDAMPGTEAATEAGTPIDGGVDGALEDAGLDAADASDASACMACKLGSSKLGACCVH